MLLKDFNNQNMGAKSNNLLLLSQGLEASTNIHLPKSGCLPFKTQEYTMDLHPEIKEKVHKYIDRLSKIRSVKRMNRILYKCKDLVMQLEFHP
jgi:hypothetical protein